jgi:hypothetical protein
MYMVGRVVALKKKKLARVFRTLDPCPESCCSRRSRSEAASSTSSGAVAARTSAASASPASPPLGSSRGPWRSVYTTIDFCAAQLKSCRATATEKLSRDTITTNPKYCPTATLWSCRVTRRVREKSPKMIPNPILPKLIYYLNREKGIPKMWATAQSKQPRWMEMRLK